MSAPAQGDQELAPGVRVLPLRTPTLPPATHTNTAIIGEERLVVVEPATPHASEQARLLDVLDRLVAGGAQVCAVLVTHHHADHIGFARPLADRFGAPLCAHRHTAARLPEPADRLLEDGDHLDLGADRTLTVLWTPGHAPGHLVAVDSASGIAHGGDMVAGTGTILIDRADDGDMGAYLDSLAALRDRELSALIPAHGPVLHDPRAVFERYIRHRLAREARVLTALSELGRPATLAELLPRVYDDTPRALWPLALRALDAHAAKLVRDGRVRQHGATFSRLPERT